MRKQEQKRIHLLVVAKLHAKLIDTDPERPALDRYGIGEFLSEVRVAGLEE